MFDLNFALQAAFEKLFIRVAVNAKDSANESFALDRSIFGEYEIVVVVDHFHFDLLDGFGASKHSAFYLHKFDLFLAIFSFPYYF